MKMQPKSLELSRVLLFFLSFCLVACGQPARIGWFGAIAAAVGFSLFFCSLPPAFSPRRRFCCGTLWFAAVQLVQLSWMTSIEFQGYYILFVYAILSFCLAAQFGLLVLLVPKEGKIPFLQILLCSGFWTLMEWIRLFFLCGYSWNPIGLALTHFTLSLQWSSVCGVFGLSFWVMLTNLYGVNAIKTKFAWRQTAVWLAIAATPYFFGTYQLGRSKESAEQKSVSVALVQTAVLPSEKALHLDRQKEFVSPLKQWKKILESLKRKKRSSWDLIVLPEAALPMQAMLTFYLFDDVFEVLAETFGVGISKYFPPFELPYAEQRSLKTTRAWCVSNLFWCQTLSNYYRAEVLAGLDHTDAASKKSYNSAFYLQPYQRSIERYDKRVLLPLAEYLPFEFLKPLSESYGIFDFYTRGSETKVFTGKIRLSPSICYEETFPENMRQGRAKGAELFVNLSNDNYYPESSLHRQHFYHARLRAVENGTPLVRSCNSGLTASVDSYGRVLSLLEEAGVCDVLGCDLKITSFPTLYTLWGDMGIVLLSACCVIIPIGIKKFNTLTASKRA